MLVPFLCQLGTHVEERRAGDGGAALPRHQRAGPTFALEQRKQAAGACGESEHSSVMQNVPDEHQIVNFIW